MGVRFALPAQFNNMETEYEGAWRRFGIEQDDELSQESEVKVSDGKKRPISDEVYELSPDEKAHAVGIFDRLVGISKHDDISKEIFDSILGSIFNYIKAMDSLTKRKLEMESGESTRHEREEADVARGRAHDALIAILNGYSRYCNRKGIDNDWRSMIGLDRKMVTRWVLAVSEYAKGFAMKGD